MHFRDITEGYAYEREVRNRARRLARNLAGRGGEEMLVGAIGGTSSKKSVFMPLCYLRTSYPDLIVGLVCGLQSPSIVDLRQANTSVDRSIHFMIGYPYSSPQELLRFSDGLPVSPDAAIEVAPKMMPHYAHYLAGVIRDYPSTFQHEFIHYDDSVRAAGKGGRPISAVGRGDDFYYNAPTERNAYYQEMFHTLDKKGNAWFQRPFRMVVRDAFRLLDKDFLNRLAPANRHRLLSRFYQVWRQKQAA